MVVSVLLIEAWVLGAFGYDLSHQSSLVSVLLIEAWVLGAIYKETLAVTSNQEFQFS